MRPFSKIKCLPCRAGASGLLGAKIPRLQPSTSQDVVTRGTRKSQKSQTRAGSGSRVKLRNALIAQSLNPVGLFQTSLQLKFPAWLGLGLFESHHPTAKMPIRNPFAKRPDVQTGLQPQEEEPRAAENGTRPTFEKVDTMGSKSSSAMSISSKRSQEPVEYKMSVVNDSGVYLPPSPPAEKKGFWPRRLNMSGTSLNGSESEIEPFPISRESFDSYRRSFVGYMGLTDNTGLVLISKQDISARSPVVPHDIGRQSLDSARLSRLPRSAINERRFERQPPTAEEGFEDVGLNDDQAKHAKKKSFFSKFGDSSDSHSPTSSRFHITGRKRGQSGTGEELSSIQRPGTAGSSKEIQEVR
ncbi:hypothetical protein G7Y89_g5715 [Cudoniella acicularis]|uniref:Uncharacterized protein n=1 Tax=Cudoniella acicularis TaxID=354080 RepID=A0A8H4W3J6_9HELO|nr:hypothetical protein G7Y89_g5715 [Cudoniella acicularis]